MQTLTDSLSERTVFWWASVLLALVFLPVPAWAADAEVDAAWNTRLKTFYFQDRPIATEQDVIALTAPVRAEDGALVPISIKAAFPQTPERFIKALYLIIDNNPSPLAGKFTLTPKSGRADMELRIRVDAYSPVRVVAETNDNQLYMTSHFVKASGGCSAPVGTDLESAMQRMGKIRMKLLDQPAHSQDSLRMSAVQPVQARLAISHPNITGLQKDQVTTLFIPPDYVKSVVVKFNDEVVFSAETDISISENPNFQFYFAPDKAGKLTATITDTENRVFTHSEAISKPQQAL